jgi:hypothetical protein
MIDTHCAKWLSAEMLCVTRFTAAGHGVSLPIVAQPYDFIADVNGRLLRVQVKIACVIERKKSKIGEHAERAHYVVGLKVKRHKVRTRLPMGYFDILCAVCSQDLIYVIPAKNLESEQVPGHLMNCIHIKTEDGMPDRKDAREAVARWKPYLNNFKIGE